jgi:hypothetical protein
LRLAERAGLPAAAQQRGRLPASAGSAAANAGVKITSVVAGMVAGADSIDDLDVIRHGALPGIFGGIRAPSTLGTFLRGFTWGNVRQLDAVARETLTGLSRQAPLLPGADSYAFLDVDSTINRVYGYAKQGADYGYTRVRGLHPLLATISTPIAAPVIADTRLRRGRRAQPRARLASWPRPSPPPERPGPPVCCWPGWTRPLTATPWSVPVSGPGCVSRSPRNRLDRSGPRSTLSRRTTGFRSPTHTRSMTRTAGSGSPMLRGSSLF